MAMKHGAHWKSSSTGFVLLLTLIYDERGQIPGGNTLISLLRMTTLRRIHNTQYFLNQTMLELVWAAQHPGSLTIVISFVPAGADQLAAFHKGIPPLPCFNLLDLAIHIPTFHWRDLLNLNLNLGADLLIHRL